jgi:hypothetical protein
MVSVITTLATMIRRTSGEGAELAAFYFAVLRGEPIPLPGLGRTQRPTLDQRLTAAQWLADRGWGRAREIVQIAGEATAEERLAILKRLTESERETLRTILTRALDETPSAPVTSAPVPAPVAPVDALERPELAEPAPESPRLPPGPPRPA